MLVKIYIPCNERSSYFMLVSGERNQKLAGEREVRPLLAQQVLPAEAIHCTNNVELAIILSNQHYHSVRRTYYLRALRILMAHFRSNAGN